VPRVAVTVSSWDADGALLVPKWRAVRVLWCSGVWAVAACAVVQWRVGCCGSSSCARWLLLQLCARRRLLQLCARRWRLLQLCARRWRLLLGAASCGQRLLEAAVCGGACVSEAAARS